MGWLARRHGVAARGVLGAEIVTRRRRARPLDGPLAELPAGSVVTALELALHPAEDLYAGALFFSFDRADEVMHAWNEWTATAPAELTSIARLMRFADRHDVPELVRGRSFAIVEAAHLGTQAEAAELLAPLRALRPELDTFSIVPPSALGHLHMESEHPEARLADDGVVGELPRGGDRRAAGGRRAGSQSPLATVELRHASGALETLRRGYFTFAAGTPADAASAAAIEAQLALVAGALAPAVARTLDDGPVPAPGGPLVHGAGSGPSYAVLRERVTTQGRRRRDAMCAPPFPLAGDRLPPARRCSHRPPVGSRRVHESPVGRAAIPLQDELEQLGRIGPVDRRVAAGDQQPVHPRAGQQVDRELDVEVPAQLAARDPAAQHVPQHRPPRRHERFS